MIISNKNRVARAARGAVALSAMALALSGCGGDSSAGSEGGDEGGGKIRVAMVCGGMTPMVA